MALQSHMVNAVPPRSARPRSRRNTFSIPHGGLGRNATGPVRLRRRRSTEFGRYTSPREAGVIAPSRAWPHATFAVHVPSAPRGTRLDLLSPGRVTYNAFVRRRCRVFWAQSEFEAHV